MLSRTCKATLLILVLAGLGPKATGQGGTLITKNDLLTVIGYVGDFGEKIDVLDNGSGRHDLLIAEPTYYNIVFLRNGLTGVQQAMIANPFFSTNADFGLGLAGIPDITGDGVEDFAIGARNNPFGGEVFVYRRNLIGAPLLLRKLSSPGGALLPNFGASVAGIEDIEGDGSGDLIVGQTGLNIGANAYPGYAYLYSGASGALLHTFSSSGGPSSEVWFGEVVEAVPDVDGDGLQDLAVGASNIYGSDGFNGFVRIYSSASGALIQELQAPSSFPFTYFGRSLAGVQDLNGDGRGELLIGSPYGNAAAVNSGVDGALLFNLVPPAVQSGMRFGYAVHAGADVNGDGLVDLLVGAPNENYGGNLNKGRAYLFSGADGSLLRTYQKPSAFQPGAAWPEYFGRAVCLSPDSNGDGRADVIVSAPGINIPGTGHGAVFSFFCLTEQAASVQMRAGSPPNPPALTSVTAPLIGSNWQIKFNHLIFAPNSLVDIALVAPGGANLPLPGGTLLVNLGQLLLSQVVPPSPGSTKFPIPSKCGLVGLALSVQGVSWDGVQYLATNALDFVIGSF